VTGMKPKLLINKLNKIEWYFYLSYCHSDALELPCVVAKISKAESQGFGTNPMVAQYVKSW